MKIATINKRASELIHDREVQGRLAEIKAPALEKANITAEYVINRLLIEAERNDEGSSPSARVHALNLLGKHLGMFTDKVQMDVTLSPATILSEIQKRRAAEHHE